MLLRTLLIAATLLTVLPSAQADRRHGEDERRRASEDDRKREEPPRRQKSLDQAVREAERQYNAQVVSTEVRREGDRTIYRLKLLNKDGKVWTVNVDAG